MNEDNLKEVQHVVYEQLPEPLAEKIAQTAISLGFNSSEWYIQYETLTSLRQANRHYVSVFLNELLPLYFKQIIAQVDNLRSCNSKEAITLVREIFEHQKIQIISSEIVGAFVERIMTKTISDKGFLKSEAISGLDYVVLKWNEGAFEELCSQTESNNGLISQLAIKFLSEMVQNNKNYKSDGKFLKNLSHNLNGNRALLQKRAKQILKSLKQREGEEQLQKKITESQELLEEESNTLRRELKEKQTKAKGPSFKDFLKQKKSQS